jgi:AraC family transcriptional regulator of adaptative response/methylated-DNA-[protein]-cysteine methyltransferase
MDDDPELKAQVEAVVALIDEPANRAELPLDVRGTAFQHRVWDALRRIPAGETWTYGQLAEAIGAPRAVRAVGAACGANPVAVVVPCHRVVGADRKLTGYRWGVEKKRQLLERERRKLTRVFANLSKL